ncbi:hypothetical protein JMJ77_0015287 [Colletotrichum scovillei]|uniref:Uncharacterized protein n=1 Tax=Colletotrichum scovillei TaxID=1209932 RepID=A0A9P7R093_9PEZI|nr:hypothetical protein JMJ77_0015287 [Colletotrichum scovillei]KAG7056905.1 hypothetical protein JMJ78_0000695 [Colletotrichum scovillei]KAG7066836.1 hypothetical protein JMJ76_0000687 [Colletotrichum scovillei]
MLSPILGDASLGFAQESFADTEKHSARWTMSYLTSAMGVRRRPSFRTQRRAPSTFFTLLPMGGESSASSLVRRIPVSCSLFQASIRCDTKL